LPAGGRARGSLALATLVVCGCVSNPLRPDPSLKFDDRARDLVGLDAFFANLDLTDAVASSAVEAPPQHALVDAQIAAMSEHVRARTGRNASRLIAQAPDTSGGDQRVRLAEAALALLPYLAIDSGEAELGRAAATALAAQLGSDAEYLYGPPGSQRSVDFAAELREGVGVARMRQLTEDMSDRVLAAFNQWSALAAPPRAIVLDWSECTDADPPNTAALVNALAPGATAFQFDYRDRESQRIKRSAWRGNADWGVQTLARVPLFVWVSGRSAEVVGAAALALREERGAIVLGEKTAGTGRVKHWQRLPGDRWFGFTIAYLLDGQGVSLRDRPLYPDACPVAGDILPLRESTQAEYDAECGKPGASVGLDAVLRYVSTASRPAALAPDVPARSPPP
jgi:hypothetical protein